MSSIPPFMVIHGDDQKKSRAFLNQSINPFPTVTRFGPNDLDLTAVIQAAQPQSFLGSDSVIVFDGFFQSTKKNIQKQILDYIVSLIKKHEPHPPIVIYSNKFLTPSQLKPFAAVPVKTFKLPAVIFTFLDSLEPGKQKQFLPLYRQITKTDAPEMLSVLIAKRIKQLMQLGDDSLKLPPWQLKKLAIQRRSFTEDQLIALHDNLFDLDRRLKSGQLVGEYGDELEYLLSQI